MRILLQLLGKMIFIAFMLQHTNKKLNFANRFQENCRSGRSGRTRNAVYG